MLWLLDAGAFEDEAGSIRDQEEKKKSFHRQRIYFHHHQLDDRWLKSKTNISFGSR
jgi:hypothetical protein